MSADDLPPELSSELVLTPEDDINLELADAVVQHLRKANAEQRAALRAYSQKRLSKLIADYLPEAQRRLEGAEERLQQAFAEAHDAEHTCVQLRMAVREIERAARLEERIVLEIDALNEENR